MKTRNRMIAVLGILLLCAGLFVACNSEVSEGAATGAGKTAYMSFDNGSSKAIEATSISQQYDIVPIGNVYWLYTATKKDNAGTTGQKTAMTPVKSDFGAGLNGVIGPMSVGKWEFKLEGYKNANSGAPSSGTYKEITIGETKKYYYESEKIYDGSSAIITLSENTASNPQVVSVDVKFAGTGNGTIEIKKGEFYWTDDNGGNVAADSNMLRIHLTLSQESVDKYDKYFNLVAENYSVGTATKTRYKLASETNTFEAAAGDYDATFAIERWTVVNNAPGERVGYVSGASGVTVKVYSQQTLKIDAQFLESVFGYVTFDGITPSPVLVQRLVLKTDTTSKTVSVTQTITHDGLSVTYPNGTKLSSDTKEADDKKTADATTGFVYTSPTASSTSVEVGDGNAVVYYTLTLNVDTSNTTLLTVEKNIGAGRDVQRVYHNGVEIKEVGTAAENEEQYKYNSSTGILTLYVFHASPIDVVYKPAVNTDVASITRGTGTNAKTYYFSTIAEAVDAAVEGDTIKLLKDVEFNNASQSKSVFYDLNSHVFTDCSETTINGNLFAIGVFAGGAGTESEPYLIMNRKQFENMSNVKEYSYYKWNGASEVDASNWSSSNYLCGSFDGNNVIFNNLDSFLFSDVWNGSDSGNPNEDTVNTYTIKNLTVNANIVTDSWIAAIVLTAGVHNFEMENITVHGFIEGATGVASFICFGAGNYVPDKPWEYDGVITFKNCHSDAIIRAKSGKGVGFIAHPMMKSSAGTINLVNSYFDGYISGAAKYISGNWFNGTVNDDQHATKNNVVYKSSDNGWTYIVEGKTGSFTIKTGALPEVIGDKFVLTADSGAIRAVASLVISPDPGNFTSTYLTEEIELADGVFTSQTIKRFVIKVNESGVTEPGIHGNNYNVINSIYNGNLGSDTIVRITQYNNTGSIISITNYYFGDKT